MTLYDVSADLASLLARLDDGELSADLEAELDRLTGTLESKLEGVAKAVRNLDAEATALEEESRRFAIRAVGARRSEARLKEWAARCLDLAGVKSVKAGLFTVRVQANGKPRVTVADEAALPAYLSRVIPPRRQADTEAIVRLWKSGGAMPPGVTVEAGRHLRIS